MTNHPNRNSRSFPYLRAWNRMMGSADYWCEETLARARREKAPSNAIYNTAGVADKDGMGKPGKWMTFDDVTRTDTRILIERFVAEASCTTDR